MRYFSLEMLLKPNKIIIGGIIFLSGIYNLLSPPVVKTVLANTHPDIWWGGIMIVFGVLMYIKTRKQTV